MTDAIPILRTSERSSFKRCWQQWFWAYRMGLTTRGESADALWFGIGVHEALAAWYLKGKKRGPHPADTFDAWCGDQIRHVRAAFTDRDREWYDEPLFLDARELGVAMLEEYIKKYGRDEHLYILAIEQPFLVTIKDDGVPVVKFGSRFDGVARDESADDAVVLLEHKTAAQIQLAYLEIDDQAGAYWAVATQVLRAQKLIGKDDSLSGILYNFLRKSMPDDRPKNELGESLNKNGTISKRQPTPAFVRELVERSPKEIAAQLQNIADEVSVMNRVRSGDLPILKSRTRDCTWCQFFAMCRLHDRGNSAWRELAKSEYTQRDPYVDQRKSASE
jgi:PD-(D/E)XK nuclease superfamily